MSASEECTEDNKNNDPPLVACQLAASNCEGVFDNEKCHKQKQNLNLLSGSFKFAIGVVCILVIGSIIKMVMKNNYEYSGNEENFKFLRETFSQIYAEFSEKLQDPNTILFAVLGILYTMLVVAIFIIIIAAYDIKNSYELGANLEQQCNNIFMEKERADHHAYSCYMAENDYSTKITKAGIFKNNYGSVKERLKTAYESLLSSIVTIILILSIIIVIGTFVANYTNLWCKNRECWVNLLQYIVIIVSLITLSILWINGNYTTITENPVTLLNPYKSILYFEAPSQVYWKDKTIDGMIISHVAYISLILITVIISFYLINEISEHKIPGTFIWGVGIILFMLLIIIPLFIKSAQAFELNIATTYKKNTDALTTLIETYEGSNKEIWGRIKRELESNINADERFKSNTESYEIQSISNINKEDRYKYLTHIVNKDNLIGIPIPQELKSIIRPEYLAGERSIEFKKDLIDANILYNDDNNKTITKDSLNTDENYDFLQKYLKEDVRIKIKDGKGDNYLKLLNNHILLSDNFKKGNPFPPDIIKILAEMRKNTSIKHTVDEYFSKINIITTFILILIAYYIYHNLYPNDIDIKIQYVAMFSFVIILIFGLIGWLLKEMWL